MLRRQSKSSLSLTAQFISKSCPIYLHICPKPSHLARLVCHPPPSPRSLPAGLLLLPLPPNSLFSTEQPEQSFSNLSQSMSISTEATSPGQDQSPIITYQAPKEPLHLPLTFLFLGSPCSLPSLLAFPETPGTLLLLYLLSLTCNPPPPRYPHGPLPQVLASLCSNAAFWAGPSLVSLFKKKKKGHPPSCPPCPTPTPALPSPFCLLFLQGTFLL